MENDIKEIKEKIEEFMKKYNVTGEVETSCGGSYGDGKLVSPKAHLIINS